MNTFIINTLTSNQYNDARELIEQCSLTDGTRGVSFLEQELNEDSDFPCFYMKYDGNRLISFLSIFLPGDGECEIYAHTHPDYRREGHFTELLKRAKKNLNDQGIKKWLLVCEPESMAAQEVMKKLGAVIERNEYLMSYDMTVKPEPQHLLEISYVKEENTEQYSAFLKGTPVGSCKVEFTRSHGVIYEFQILPEYRGKGYGTEMLLLILKHLLKTGASKILLHVNGANTAAHAMYSHHGFINEEQIDYWRVD